MRIAVLDDYQSVALRSADWSGVQARAEVDVFHDHLVDPDALVERLLPYDAVLLMRERTPFPAAVIERLPALRHIVTTGRRNPSLDVEAARARGITVSNTGSPADSTVELTWGLMLALARHLVEEANDLAAGGWQRTVGRDLAGSTLGIVGLGRIGTRVAEIARAFGMHVLAWSPSLDDERAAAAGATRTDLDGLLAASDVVSLHVALNDGTRGLVGARELGLMRPGALLVNTCRGPVVDTPAAPARHPAPRLCHRTGLPHVLRRGGREPRGLVGRSADPAAVRTMSHRLPRFPDADARRSAGPWCS